MVTKSFVLGISMISLLRMRRVEGTTDLHLNCPRAAKLWIYVDYYIWASRVTLSLGQMQGKTMIIFNVGLTEGLV